MSESQTDTNKEELRAFEKKMHDEGAAAFADGPSPWETWDDKSDPEANNRVWEGSSKRIYPKQRPQQSLGDRVLSGLALLSLATMVVGIAGVYFSDPQPQKIAATGTGVQPLPIDRTPPDADSIIARAEQLPPPAAGTPAAADHAAATRRGDAAPPAPATGAADAADSMMHPAAQSVPTGYPPAAASGTAGPGALLETDAAAAAIAPQHVAANDNGRPPAAAPVGITTATAAIETGTGPAAGVTAPVAISAADAEVTTQAGTDSVDTAASLETLPRPPAASAAAPAAAIETGTGPAAGVTAPVAISAADAEITSQAGTVASLEALPVPMAGPAVTVDEAPADNTAMPPVAATDSVVAIAGTADQGSEDANTAPAEAAKEIIPATNTGDWVVNLASYTRESTARRMLAGFRAKGVDAELVTVTINDKPMHRVRVAGFASSHAAKASITPLEQQLDLEGVWISRE